MTNLPTDIVEIVEKDLQTFDSIAQDSQIMGAQVDKVIRNSKNAWIPTSHWIGGWLWYSKYKKHKALLGGRYRARSYNTIQCQDS